jgi:peptidoglycan hydrolase-like protein with peptidoglycan-binding domain
MTVIDRLAALSLIIGALITAGCSSGSSPGSATTSTTFVTVPFTTSSITSTATSGRPAATTSGPLTPVPSTGTASTTKTTTAVATTVPPRNVSQPGDNVHLGDTGSGVKQIQTALVAHGYTLSADGTFGPQTAQAVKDFQTKNGLAADGVVGPATWAKLGGVPVATTVASTTPKATTTTAKR